MKAGPHFDARLIVGSSQRALPHALTATALMLSLTSVVYAEDAAGALDKEIRSASLSVQISISQTDEPGARCLSGFDIAPGKLHVSAERAELTAIMERVLKLDDAQFEIDPPDAERRYNATIDVAYENGSEPDRFQLAQMIAWQAGFELTRETRTQDRWIISEGRIDRGGYRPGAKKTASNTDSTASDRDLSAIQEAIAGLVAELTSDASLKWSATIEVSEPLSKGDETELREWKAQLDKAYPRETTREGVMILRRRPPSTTP
jgi:hypothetical protein